MQLKTYVMKKVIDIEKYNRKEHFLFFKEFEEPFFGVTTLIDCGKAYEYCKEKKISFFSYYLFQTNKALNQIENLRQRIVGNQLIEFAKVNVSTTMARKDNTFGFAYIEQSATFEEFYYSFLEEKKRIEKGHELMPCNMDKQAVHYSALPWFTFSSLSHARRFSINDSCPKISFGKIHQYEGRYKMPISIHAHHALVDGYHIGNFIEILQDHFNEL